MLTKADEGKIQDIVIDAIKEVVLPAMEDLSGDIRKLDKIVGKVEGRLEAVENRLEQMDRKLDIVTAKVYTHDSQIKKLETAISA